MNTGKEDGLSHQLSNLSIEDQNKSNSKMSIQSDSFNNSDAMSIQDQNSGRNNGSKMSIMSTGSDLHGSKTKTASGQDSDFKVPTSKNNSSSRDLVGGYNSGKNQVQSIFEEEKSDLSLNIKDLKPLDKLGQGSQGVVEKMLHVPTNKVIALKVNYSYRPNLYLFQRSNLCTTQMQTFRNN